MQRLLLTILMVLLTTLMASSQVVFVSKRLSNIAKATGIKSPTDIISYKGRQLVIRCNAYGEIEHIGYHLFGNEVRQCMNQYVSDFLERYILELDLPSQVVHADRRTLTIEQRLDVDKVLIKGDKNLLFCLDSTTTINVENIALQYYKVQLIRDGRYFEIDVPKNCQLLKGMDIQELEDRLAVCLRRIKPITPESVNPEGLEIWTLRNIKIDSTRRDAIKILGKSYLHPYISDCRYVLPMTTDTTFFISVINAEQPEMSVQNIMTSGINGDIPMMMTIDKYGNAKDTLLTSVNRWLALCHADECNVYFGIKEMDDTIVKGVVFALNKDQAFHHMLSVSFPLSVLSSTEKFGSIGAKLYAYIPLNNLTEKYFYFRPLP